MWPRSLAAIWCGFIVGVALMVLTGQRQTDTARRSSWQTQSATGWLTLPTTFSIDASPLQSQILIAASKYGLDPALVMAVIKAESGHHPNAISPRGAMGLMQIMPETAADAGNINPTDPASNLDTGCRLLARLIETFGGDTELALAAYNAGPATVRRWGTIPPFRETRNFIRRVKENYKELTGLSLDQAERLIS